MPTWSADASMTITSLGRTDFFEDSLELSSNLKWTWDMIPQWVARRGYDPTLLLPALTNAGRQGTSTPYYDFTDGSQRGIGQEALVICRWDPAKKTWVAASEPGGKPLK